MIDDYNNGLTPLNEQEHPSVDMAQPQMKM